MRPGLTRVTGGRPVSMWVEKLTARDSSDDPAWPPGLLESGATYSGQLVAHGNIG